MTDLWEDAAASIAQSITVAANILSVVCVYRLLNLAFELVEA